MGATGPSGDFEIQEDRRNDLGRGRGIDMGAEPDLMGNTVDAGSSAAQLPQKNILERKEVLIGGWSCQSNQTLIHSSDAFSLKCYSVCVAIVFVLLS